IDLGEAQSVDRVVLFPARPVDFPDTPGFGFPERFKIEGSTEESFSEPFVIADRSAEDFPNPGDEPVEFSIDAKETRYVRVTATKLWERTNDFVFALGEMRVFSGVDLLSEGKSVSSLDTIDSGRWNRNHLVDG
ncbi:MAG: hypothetical protein KC931_22750, partial [Candidatus Omnitrophica bacterium]|nr:hypothetical protein [Candidatus Omnitrophota bacterium]